MAESCEAEFQGIKRMHVINPFFQVTWYIKLNRSSEELVFTSTEKEILLNETTT